MKLIFVVLIFSVLTTYGQKDSTIFLKEFGWTINLPSDFKIVDTSTRNSLAKTGKKIVEESTGQKVNINAHVDLLSAQKGEYNYFSIYYTNSKSINEKNWPKNDDSVRDILLRTFKKQIPIIPETSASVISIDGVQFKKTQLIFKGANATMVYTYLAAFYRGHNLSINYMYIDPNVGEEILTILNTSKFEKQ